MTSTKALAALLAGLIVYSSASGHGDAYHTIEILTREINQNPGDTQLYVRRAEEYHSVSDWKHALADYQRVAKLDPEYERLVYFRGLTLHAAGFHQDALDAFNAYLRQHPNCTEGIIARARALHKLGRYRKAHDDYTQAIALLDSPPAALYIERATALADGGQVFLTDALLGLDEAIQEFGHLTVLETTAIKLELARDHYESALQRIDHLYKRATRKESWLALRGEILEQLGRRTQALTAYNEALNMIEYLPQHIRATAAMQNLASDLKERQKNLCIKPAASCLQLGKKTGIPESLSITEPTSK